MKIYARIEEKRVAEVVSLDVEPDLLYHPSLVWVDVTDTKPAPGFNYLYDGKGFTAPVIEIQEPVFIATSRKAAAMDEAGQAIAPLQDAVDVGMATDAEAALLTAWKKYRVLLNRVDVSAAPDITWPEAPGSLTAS
ncbi:tail fiber assembly protein [Pantoea vagans]|uniref:tail fiber assembly protein n=1 Tax=Pantoea vagans TaxID=470934 RepID=UPI0023AF2C4B|nr:tail fiber assembly protein [Pantoea vagans]MDE8559059.1 tail fiber assembly protein [Pantoea vagans]